MKVIEHLERAKRPLISFEIIPPKRGGDVNDLMRVIEDLRRWEPPFIDITSHPAELVYLETPGGIQKKVMRRRPGTLGICALIQNKYGIDAVPHVLCHGFTKEETEDFLIELRYLGIENLLAIRGDDNGYRKPVAEGRSANATARDLIEQVSAMNQGRYLLEPVDAKATDFCVGAGCYPEKHFESPNLETDIRHVKAKVDAGAEYLVTQMFFDNAHYFAYVEQLRAAGVEVPIIPGLKILTTKKHLSRIPSAFYCDIPKTLSDELDAAKPEHVLDLGVEWALQQTRELLARGVPAVHFYIMQSSKAIGRLLTKLDP